MFKNYLYLISFFALYSFSYESYGQLRFDNEGYHFKLKLNPEELKNIKFIEEELYSTKINNLRFYASGCDFSCPLTKAEYFEYCSDLSTYSANDEFIFDLVFNPSFRRLAIIGFSKIYWNGNFYPSGKKREHPIVKLPLNQYPKIFDKNEMQLIYSSICDVLCNRLDSNYSRINAHLSFETIRVINYDKYNLYPQQSLKSLESELAYKIKEGKIKAYSTSSLNKSLSKKTIEREYFNYPEAKASYSKNGAIIGYDTVYVVRDCYKIQLSETLNFNFEEDTSKIYNDFPYSYLKYMNLDSPLFTLNFKYNALGLRFGELDGPIKVLWLDYDEVRATMTKSGIDFKLWESIFTKNLFDIFEIENLHWTESDYKK